MESYGTSVKLHTDTIKKLNKLKDSKSQSYNDIVLYLIRNEEVRLLQEQDILEARLREIDKKIN